MNTRRILVVGDPAIGKALQRALLDKPYEVVLASSGEDALWRLRRGSQDAVIAAAQLRGISGLELAREIKARYPGLPVLLAVDDIAPALAQRAAAVAEVVREPLTPEVIAEAVDRLVPAANCAPALPAENGGGKAPAMARNRLTLRLKSITLFLLAPLFVFFYVLAFPVVSLGAFLWSTFNSKEEEAEKLGAAHGAVDTGKPGRLPTIAKVFSAALIGVAFSVVGPILGIGLLLALALQAWVRLGAKAIEPGEA